MTLRIDRSSVRESYATRLDNCLDNSRNRRDRNREAGACINENSRGTHGPATHGVRCERCKLVHKGKL